MSGRERRRSARFTCPAELLIEWGSVTVPATLREIGHAGMFIETNQPLWLRAEFTVRILLPESLVLKCVVRRIEPGRGMGVEFKDLSEATRLALDHLLWRLTKKRS